MATDTGIVIHIVADDQSGAVMDAVEARLKSASAAGQRMGRSLQEAGHGAIPAMSAASASVRTLQGNILHNTRAVERFLSTTLGLGPVMEAAFPVVGAIALGAVVVEQISNFIAFKKEAEGLPAAIDKAFGRMHESAQASIDDLQLTNDKLQESIDKLEKKPRNGIAIALDEALKVADELAKRVDSVDDAIEALVKKNHVGLTQSITTGQVGTGNVESKQQEFADTAERLLQRDRILVDEATTAEGRRLATIRQANDQYKLRADRIEEINASLKKEQDQHDHQGTFYNLAGIDNTARIKDLQGFKQALEDENALAGAKTLEGVLEGEKTQLTDATEAASKLNEELRKQQEWLEKIAKLGVGNIYSGGLNVSDATRRGQDDKLGDKSRGELQDQFGESAKKQEQARQDAAEQKRNADEVAAQQYAIAREVQESRIREAEAVRRITDEQAAYDLAAGRISAQQRLQVEQDAANKELATKKSAMEELRAADVGISGNSRVDGPKELQRDLDQQTAIERQHNAEMLQLDQQAFEARREAVKPIIDDIFQPLLDKPKSVSDAFKKMGEDIEKTLAGIAEKRITDAVVGSIFGPDDKSQSSGGQHGGATTRGIGGVLGALFGGLMGHKSKSATTGADSIPPTQTAGDLGVSGGDGPGHQITIINQSSQPVSASTSSSSKGAFGNMILSMVLKDASTGGPMTQAFGGAFKTLGL